MHTLLKPRSTIGIFGGGQLGRMLAQAASKFGYNIHIYDPEADTPACRVSECQTCAPYEDLAAVARFAKSCDVITYEFENIPLAAINQANQYTDVFPNARALEITHDRLTEKAFLKDKAGAPVVDHRSVETMADLTSALAAFNSPCILKTRRFGYDGKGQVKVDGPYDVKSAFARLGGADLIAEKFAPFIREFSIIAARDRRGKIACYPLTENVHKDHRLHTSAAPADDPQNISEKALSITRRILNALDYTGVMGVEFFELSGGVLIVNEIAPRVHNSGHWTQNAGCTNQFEQHIRAICGLPLGRTTPTHKTIMTNLIGGEIKQAADLSKQVKTFVHNYGKSEIRPGRKMGHVNRIV